MSFKTFWLRVSMSYPNDLTFKCNVNCIGTNRGLKTNSFSDSYTYICHTYKVFNRPEVGVPLKSWNFMSSYRYILRVRDEPMTATKVMTGHSTIWGSPTLWFFGNPMIQLCYFFPRFLPGMTHPHFLQISCSWPFSITLTKREVRSDEIFNLIIHAKFNILGRCLSLH